MGANVECEELGCVVGAPFKPNKLREVRGLVWKPWINKPSEMTMRCADICHHAAPASKYKLCKTPFSSSPSPQPVFHMVPLVQVIPSSFYLFPCSICTTFNSSTFIHFNTSISSSFFTLLLLILVPFPSLHLHSSSSSLPSDSSHPSAHPCMHGWLSVRSSVCAIGRATEPLWHLVVSQQQRRPEFRPRKCLFIKEGGCETAHGCISSFSHIWNK